MTTSATLRMTIGDYRQFELTVKKFGVIQDLAGIQSLNFKLQNEAGVEVANWGLGSGVVVQSPTTNGQAILSITPAMLVWATQTMGLTYTWSLVDSIGNPTLVLERGAMYLTLPPP